MITELVLLFGAMRVFARLMGPDLLPSLKVVLDMGVLAICGWFAGRVGTPRVLSAAALAAAGLSVYDFTPYLPLNVPWVLRFAKNALGDSRYLSSLAAALIIQALMFGSLFRRCAPQPPTETAHNVGYRTMSCRFVHGPCIG